MVSLDSSSSSSLSSSGSYELPQSRGSTKITAIFDSSLESSEASSSESPEASFSSFSSVDRIDSLSSNIESIDSDEGENKGLLKNVKVLLSNFLNLLENCQTLHSVGTAMVDLGRVVHELVKPFFESAKIIGRILMPLRFLSWAGAPFCGINFVQDGIDVIKTPGWGKILPAMKAATEVGFLAEMAANAGYLLEDVGIAAVQNVGVWAAPLTAVAVALQALTIVINGWGFYEAANTLSKLKKHLGENDGTGNPPTQEQYQAAVDYLTKEPETKMEKFRAKFFKVLSGKQEAKIKEIFEKYESGDLGEKEMKETMDAIKHRFHLKEFALGLAIAAAVTGIIGVLILTFAPTPLAPLGWILIGASVSASLLVLGINIYASKLLNKKLARISPNTEEKTSWYKKPVVWVKRAFKCKRNARSGDYGFELA